MAARLLDAPMALLTLIAPERQWFKGKAGIAGDGAAPEDSFCVHLLPDTTPDILVVEDALSDPVFSGLPLVRSPPNVRFYAGTPIVVFGKRVGSLGVFDTVPRARPSEKVLADLRDLAAIGSNLFALKDEARRGEVFKEALIREEKRHALALEASSIASWVWDVQSGVLECDPLMTQLFNLPDATRVPVDDIYGAIDRRDRAMAETGLWDALAEEDDYSVEYRIEGTTPTRWLAGRGRVVERDEDGRPLLVFGVNFDISEQKEAEERQRLLLRELNHRVKNTLATVQAMATQTVRHSRQPQEFLSAFGGRLHALGKAHGLLSDHEWRGIGLTDLINLQVMPYVEEERDRIHLAGENCQLSPDQALALGLVLHELASNAVKYGSLSVPRGRVDLTWDIVPEGEAGRRLVIDWQEREGPKVGAPEHHGFGSILIQRSMGKLLTSRVEHEFLEAGVHARISLVLDEPAEA